MRTMPKKSHLLLLVSSNSRVTHTPPHTPCGRLCYKPSVHHATFMITSSVLELDWVAAYAKQKLEDDKTQELKVRFV